MQEDNLSRPGLARGAGYGAGGQPDGRGDMARA